MSISENSIGSLEQPKREPYPAGKIMLWGMAFLFGISLGLLALLYVLFEIFLGYWT